MQNGMIEDITPEFVTMIDESYCANDLPSKSAMMSEVLLNNPLSQQNINLKEILEHIEVTYIQQALEKANGVVAHAAEKLGLRRTTLVEKMRKHNLNSKN